jgi:hypothetical protein
MSYCPLATPGACRSIRDFVANHLDMQLADIHAMLRLAMPHIDGLEAGCNLASVASLCGVIAGVSTVFYRQTGSPSARFHGVLTDFYPWKQQPSGGAPRDVSVKAINDNYRNPLVHTLAVATETEGRGRATATHVSSDLRPFGVGKQGLMPGALAALEKRRDRRQVWLPPVVVANAGMGFDIKRIHCTGARGA